MAALSGFLAAIPAIASVASSALSFFGQSEQNSANRGITKDQMDFQERMSGTSYQRGMQDMRLAGLNPILAYKQGGASTPQGAGIPAVNELGGIASSALQARNLLATTTQTKAATKATNATTAKTVAETAILTETLKRERDFGKGPVPNILDTIRRMFNGVSSAKPVSETLDRYIKSIRKQQTRHDATQRSGGKSDERARQQRILRSLKKR